MRHPPDPSRRCLTIDQWPESDRGAWNVAIAAGDPLSLQRNHAAMWKPTTRHKYRRGYGRWLNFLHISGAGWSRISAERVTPQRVSSYVKMLEKQSASHWTIVGRVAELLAVMLVFYPDKNWSWLKAILRQLENVAALNADKSLPKVLSCEVIDAAERNLRALSLQTLARRDTLKFRDWLMVLVLAALPLRLGNFTRLSLRRHMKKSKEIWFIDIDGQETKTGRPFVGVVPRKIGQLLDHYVKVVRPKLERAKSDRLWLGLSGNGLADRTVYGIIVSQTRRGFGVGINPHQFRQIFATSLCLSDLDSLGSARAALGHSSRRTTRNHYARATGLAASRKHRELMDRLRKVSSLGFGEVRRKFHRRKKNSEI